MAIMEKATLTLIRSEAAPVFELPGVTFHGLAAPSRGSRENSVWRVQIAPGTAGQKHSVTREEIFVALSGQALATIEGEEFSVGAGDALIVPANSSFSLSNSGDEPFIAVAILPVGAKAVTEAGEFVPPWAQ